MLPLPTHPKIPSAATDERMASAGAHRAAGSVEWSARRSGGSVEWSARRSGSSVEWSARRSGVVI